MRSGRSRSEESEGDDAIPDPRRAGDRRSDRRRRCDPRARVPPEGAARARAHRGCRGGAERRNGHPSRPGRGAGGRSHDRGGHTRAVGRAHGDARPRDVRADAGGRHRDQEILDALGQRLRHRRSPRPRPALRASTMGSDAHGADGRDQDHPGADRRSPPGGRRSGPGRGARFDRGAARGRVPRSGATRRAGAGTDAPRSSLGRAAEAARLREEPADLLGGRRGLRGGRVPRRAQVLLPPGAGGARVPRRAGRPCRVHRRAAIGALSAVDRCRAG